MLSDLVAFQAWAATMIVSAMVVSRLVGFSWRAWWRGDYGPGGGGGWEPPPDAPRPPDGPEVVAEWDRWESELASGSPERAASARRVDGT